MRAQFGRRILSAALFAALLAACGQQASGPQPPTAAPVVTAQPGATTAPTAAPVVTAQPGATTAPTAAPVVTAQPGATTAPTAAAPKPAFAFEPRGGLPGTVVTVRGWGFQPNGWVGVYLGVPSPVGTALGSVQADPAGSWQTQVAIPATLPEGRPVPAGNVFLVTMNANFQAQASAPFAFQAPPQPAPQLPPVQQARDNVETLLVAYGTADIRPYLHSSLRQHYDSGKTLPYLLGFDPLLMEGKPELGTPQRLPGGGVVDVSVVVAFPGERQYYIFTTMPEDGFWKVTGAQFLRSEPVHPPFPGPGWVEQIRSDATGDGVEENYFVRAGTVPAQVSFGDAYLDHNSVSTRGVLVAQLGPHNPLTLLAAEEIGVRSSAAVIRAFPQSDPAMGYLVAFDRRGPLQIHLYPLRADGSAAGEPFSVVWDGVSGTFRLADPAPYPAP